MDSRQELRLLVSRLRSLQAQATPGPWRWWTSNSHYRLSSDPSGKDGDVISTYRARDGLTVVDVREADARLIEETLNALPFLLHQLELATGFDQEDADV